MTPSFTNKETTMPQTFNPDELETKTPNISWDEPLSEPDDDEPSEDAEELDPFDDETDEDDEADDDDIEASPDADDEDNWDREDDAEGRWSGSMLYGNSREMSDAEIAFYDEDRDYDAMNDFYGDDDE